MFFVLGIPTNNAPGKIVGRAQVVLGEGREEYFHLRHGLRHGRPIFWTLGDHAFNNAAQNGIRPHEALENKSGISMPESSQTCLLRIAVLLRNISR